MRNGIPYDVALTMPPTMRRAYYILFGVIEGGKWNWNIGEPDPVTGETPGGFEVQR